MEKTLMQNENDKNALASYKSENNTVATIISLGGVDDFIIKDFLKSGINKATIKEYIEGGYLHSTQDYWQLQYPELETNSKSNYYTRRLKNPQGKSKYIKPSGESSRLFRPLALPFESFSNPDDHIIIVEGEKKAIKGVQEGFNVVGLGGVWCWKQQP